MKAEIRLFIDGVQIGQAESEHATAEEASAWLSAATAPIRRSKETTEADAFALYEALKANEEAWVHDRSVGGGTLNYVTVAGHFDLQAIARRLSGK